MAFLQFDCRFQYRSGFALDLAFTADPPVTALVGPSGCGKTTVLNLIAGILTPAAGRICLDGVVLFDAEAKINLPPERRRIGYVFQNYQLFPHMTVLQNLEYGGRRSTGLGPPHDKVIGMLDLAELLSRRPAELSGGQQQRVAIGRALLRRPKILLLDEPVNALDDQLRTDVLAYLSRVVAEFRMPALLINHDFRQAGELVSGVVHVASR